MKYRGVVYDVGLRFTKEALSVDPFSRGLVEHDIRAIADTLHANAVRIEGEDIDRLVTATQVAHACGLTVFFNPWKMNADADETRVYLAEAAKAAEQLRNDGVDIVFVTGCEYTIFSDGIYPGSTYMERGMWLGAQMQGAAFGAPAALPDPLPEKAKLLNKALKSFAETIRADFQGQLTYSAGAWEDVDWGLFDLVGVDYYRRGETDQEYVTGLDHYRHGKPLAVMEVGCCAYEGAGALGDAGFAVLQGTNPDGTGIWRDGVAPTRSEREQADYVGRQLELLSGAGVDAVFIFNFSFPAMRTGEGQRDLDRANFALVKTYPEDDPRSKAMPPWEPKEAFHRVADFYRREAEAAKRAG
ncbi:hypothetical protein ABTZ59_27755 [Streptomyces sp. NPDC094034]|uniref:hypothetical protein n=1 Tax=Streptomyces sp. NPDC094034 TaxID=3155309 RepID=UPI0033216B37